MPKLSRISFYAMILHFFWSVVLAQNPQNAVTLQQQKIWPLPSSTTTGGWLKTIWHQEYPFNACCPYDTIRQARSLVGCVGLAMAQILHYYHQVIAISPFSDADNYLSMQNGFACNIGEPYLQNGIPTWSDLNNRLAQPVHHENLDSSEVMADELCYAAGISIQTLYSSLNSEAFECKAVQALCTRFGMPECEWMNGSDSLLLSTLKRNMKNGEPAIVVITRSGQAAHAIVVDGFNERGPGTDDDLYHINYGGLKPGTAFWWNLWPSHRWADPMPNGFNMIKGAIVNAVPLARLKPPTAACTASLFRGYAPLDVAFEDDSNGHVTRWDWDFGDNSEHANGPNVRHTYESAGSYTVTLTVTGVLGTDHKISKDYIIVENPPFIKSTIKLPIIKNNIFTIGDLDNDNDLDVITMYGAPANRLILSIFENQNATFKEKRLPYSVSDKSSEDEPSLLDAFLKGSSITGDDSKEKSGAAYWGALCSNADHDGDNDLDLFLMDSENGLVRFDNNQGIFTPNTCAVEIPNNRIIDIHGIDLDNDGDRDIELTGVQFTSSGNMPTTTYIQNKNGLMEKSQDRLIDPGFGYIDFGDFDQDGDFDILAIKGHSGTIESSQSQAGLFLNYRGRFTQAGPEIIRWPAVSAQPGEVRWLDDNQDGLLDIYQQIRAGSILHRNRGGYFTSSPPTDLLFAIKTNFADLNNDGQIDMVAIYRDSIIIAFKEEPGFRPVYRLHPQEYGYTALFGDYDNDQDLDLFFPDAKAGVTIFENTSLRKNTIPEAPTGLTAKEIGDSVSLSWERASDQESPAQSLTYNLYVGTRPGGTDIMSPLSGIETGIRKVVELGNVQYNIRWPLRGLAPGTYYWSVQAVDNSFAGSCFSREKSFTIGKTTLVHEHPAAPLAFSLSQNYPNPFNGQTVIHFVLVKSEMVRLEIFNVNGALVCTLIDKILAVGEQRVIWNGCNGHNDPLHSGAYICRLQAGSVCAVKKMIMVK